VGHDEPTTVDLTLAPLLHGVPAASKSTPPVAVDKGSRKISGYVALGLGAVTATVATISGFRAIALAHDYNTEGSASFQNPSTRSTGIAFRTTSDVLFATTLVCTAVGTYWLVFPLKRTATPASATVTLGPLALAIQGAFE
jgi:hypothetical protein